MKIGIAMTFAEGISGGRLHATLFAMELAAQGHEVTVVCNQAPSFLDTLPLVPGREAVVFERLKYDLLRPPKALVFDLWIVVQERSLNGRFFLPVFENARRGRTPLLLLAFETPNWQESMLGRVNGRELDFLLPETVRLGAQCLCSTSEGVRWARQYFPGLPATSFHVLNPPILAGFFHKCIERDDRLIVATTRRASAHKGHGTILHLLNRRLQGRRVVLIDGYGVSFEMRQYVRRARERDGLEIELQAGVSEAEKYRLFKAARLLLFPSAFEGFGLPPGEARYWGTPVVCYDLPVLREVYGDSLTYVPTNDIFAFEETVHRELAKHPDYSPSPAARRVGDFSRWSIDVRRVLEAVMDRATPPLTLEQSPNSLVAVPPPLVIFDQIANWNKNDTAMAAGETVEQCLVVSFDVDCIVQGRVDRARQYLLPEETGMPPGNASEDLRGKLTRVLERRNSTWVFLTEDLLVCSGETVRANATLAEESGAHAVAVPVTLHLQEDGPRHYRTVDGQLLSACGCFHREFLLRCLAETAAPGCRSQPVIDASYLILANGGRIVAGVGNADRLPPRDLVISYDVLPGGVGTWHESYRAWRGIADLLDPIPCRRPDDDEELVRMIRFRRGVLNLIADRMSGHVEATDYRPLIDFLRDYSRRWRTILETADQWSTDRVCPSYLADGRPFITEHHLRSFLDFVASSTVRTELLSEARGPMHGS